MELGTFLGPGFLEPLEMERVTAIYNSESDVSAEERLEAVGLMATGLFRRNVLEGAGLGDFIGLNAARRAIVDGAKEGALAALYDGVHQFAMAFFEIRATLRGEVASLGVRAEDLNGEGVLLPAPEDAVSCVVDQNVPLLQAYIQGCMVPKEGELKEALDGIQAGLVAAI